jgi:hypothetical protein
MRQIEWKQPQANNRNATKNAFLAAVRHISAAKKQVQSGLNSVQAREYCNEWGVEATCFSASWRGTSSLFRKAGKRAEIIRTYGKV